MGVFENIPKSFIERYFSKKLSHFGEHGIVGFPEGLAVADSVQMSDFAPGAVEVFGGFFKGKEGVFEA